ncbi:MAG: hypothetical protein CMP91_08510 [Gammaproteobacteria bacterium]|nr:hypothetical protein [Gammaproteobacteria bacterium]MAY03659.1 hypothetical protein [Gammaproteobacteria bacterium]|tara:strand:- start:1546 stop:1896 length:351 start_codon:yes stop_codon:yes gene_type:complete
MTLVDEKIIAQLVRDIGVDNTRIFIAALDDEFISRCNNIKQACKKKSLDTLMREAHAFKGAALTYGAAPLGALLYELESKARDGKQEAFALAEKVLSSSEQTLAAYRELDFDQYSN